MLFGTVKNMKTVFDRLIRISSAAILMICFAGCGSKKTDEVQNTSCFIYTDGLLDDLCAIEYLSGRYDNAIILLQDPEGLAESDYASETVKDKKDLLDTASRWFSEVTDYSDNADISKADIYLLAPLTEFAILLEENPSLKSSHALMMAGETDGPDGAGEEWNAAADPDSYRYVIENMADLTQITAPECEDLFLQNGYPVNTEFLDEYISHMESINENVCCYDLQAVSNIFKEE